jgi:hypothetical protein
MEKMNFKKACAVAIPLLVFIPCLLVFKSDSSSIVLKDQAKIERIILHNMIGEHACHCFPPMISTNPGFQITPTADGAKFRWVCDVAASYQVNYGTSNAKGTLFPASPSGTYKDNTITVTGLKPNTTYHAGPYSQVSGHAVKKWLMSNDKTTDWTFTTLAGATGFSIKGTFLDSKGVGISGVKVAISGDSTGSVTTPAAGTFEFANLKAGKYTITPTKDKFTFVPENKAYTALAADQKDQNFVGSTGVAVMGRTDENLCVVYDVAVKTVSANEATITWKTSSRATSQVEYGTTKSYGSKSSENTELSTDHYIQLFDLSPGATYFYRVVSKIPEVTTPFYSTDFSLKTEAFEKRIADKNNYFVDPNPCNDRTEFNYYLYQPVNNLSIEVLSLSGRKVAVLEAPRSALNTGWNRIAWNVKDNAGKSLVNGLYVYKMKFSRGNSQEVFKSAQLSVRR